MSLNSRDAKAIDRSLQKGEHLIETPDRNLEYTPSEENISYDPGRWESWDPQENTAKLEDIGQAIDTWENLSLEESDNYSEDKELRDLMYRSVE